MLCATLLSIVMVVLGSATESTALPNYRELPRRSSLNNTCQEIAASISAASDVYYISSLNYTQDIEHWANSSTQIAACSFEPGTVEDVGIALQILAKTRTPFAVKGGGHTTNPGFSSTVGVQIAMSRFSDIVYDSGAQAVTVGAGLIWDQVYAALEPYGVNVVGARASGVGVAGVTLEGGYSWLTNQYGLTIDTVQAFELVMPNGTVIDVTETSSPDLFFALKGSLNNFGIVTKFTLKTFPQTQIWGGLINYAADALDQFNLATANFAANNTDPKAVIITTYTYTLGELATGVFLFYDAPVLPAGTFDEFLAIPSVSGDPGTRSFLSYVQATYTPPVARTIFNTVSATKYPISFLQSIANESIYWGENLTTGPAVYTYYEAQIFQSTLFTHNTSPSAYPPSRTQGLTPLNIYYMWQSPDSDQRMQDAIRISAQTLQAKAFDGDQSEIANVTIAPNFAIFDTPLEHLYGDNVPRLKAIKAVVDPEGVMGLAGGFKL